MTKSKAFRFGQKGGLAVEKSMGRDWHKILADLRWGKISSSQFVKLRKERKNAQKNKNKK